MSEKTKRLRRKFVAHRGQSLIELALMLPFLLVLIIGSIEVGRLFFAKAIVTNAAREGAYYLSTHPGDYDPDTGFAPHTTLAAQEEANNSGIPEVIVTVAQAGESDEGGEEEEGGGWWSWGGWGGWGWGGGCVCETEPEDLDSIRVTVQANVPNVMFLSLVGSVFRVNATDYSEFPVSSCVEMLVP